MFFPIMGYSIFYPHIQGYEQPNFEKPTCPGKNDCWLISPLEYNLNSIPQKKMIPEKFFESATPKKVNTANLPTRKIYIEIGTPGKITIQWPPGFLHPYACTDKKWNSPILCHCRTLVNCWGKISKDAKIKKKCSALTYCKCDEPLCLNKEMFLRFPYSCSVLIIKIS